MLWKEIYEAMEKSPAQLKVVKKMLETGISIKENNLYINGIQIDDTKFAKAIGVDRRVIKSTIQTINENPTLAKFFINLKSIADFTDVAREMGWGAMEVIVEDPSKPGILASISQIISEEGISIRQAFVDDPEIVEEPKLHVVTHSKLPSNLILKLMNLKNIKKIIIE